MKEGREEGTGEEGGWVIPAVTKEKAVQPETAVLEGTRNGPSKDAGDKN